MFDGFTVKSDLKSYEGPFGVGYLVAMIKAIKKKDSRQLDVLDDEKNNEINESFPVQLARKAIENYVQSGNMVKVPKDTPNFLKGRSAIFVSLKKKGELRGCIGTTKPTQASTAQEIINNAISAATQDPRFLPVETDEIDNLTISVDILTEPELVDDINQLNPKKYGVIVEHDNRTGLLLPDLEGVDSIEQQIDIAKRKAGISPEEDIIIYRFEVKRYF